MSPESYSTEGTPLLTPRGIPVNLRPYFQEYILEDLDPVRDSFTVIERTLAWGDIAKLRWLFRLFGIERLRHWIQQYGWYGLPRRRLKLFLCVLNLRDYRRGERKWPH